MALTIPPSLKLKHLRNLAFQCGVSFSGTKPLLTSRLIDEIVPVLPNHEVRTNLPPSRILSIDMGIRNLAYCILDLRPRSVPSVTAWRRIAVSSAPLAPAESAESALTKEAFDPPALSSAAYTLLRRVLLPHNPTHILIERQRFRSMGSPHILEWTVRVNTFESMLYAVLQTLKSEGIWHGHVIPIFPGKVAPFWIGPDSDAGADAAGQLQSHKTKARTTKSAKLLNKGAKIDLVKTWLENGRKLSLGSPEAEITAKAYLDKWHRLPGRTKGKSVGKLAVKVEVEEVGKLDDLADSLLQGMAWIKWEENKRQVFENGVQALDLDRTTAQALDKYI